MTRSRLTTVRWFTLYKLRNENFAKVLDLDPERKIFSSAFIEKIAARRSNLERTFWKISVVNLAIIGVLFLNTAIVDTEFSFAGVKATDVKKIKEILLFLWTTLNFISAIIFAEVQALEGIVNTWIAKATRPELTEFVRMQYGQRIGQIPSLPDPHVPHHLRTAVAQLWVLLLAVSVLFFFIALVGASFVVTITVIVEVIKYPSLPGPWSLLIVAYTIVGLLVSLLLLFFRWIPLPYRDYTVVMELSELLKKDRNQYEARLRELLKK